VISGYDIFKPARTLSPADNQQADPRTGIITSKQPGNQTIFTLGRVICVNLFACRMSQLL